MAILDVVLIGFFYCGIDDLDSFRPMRFCHNLTESQLSRREIAEKTTRRRDIGGRRGRAKEHRAIWEAMMSMPLLSSRQPTTWIFRSRLAGLQNVILTPP
jgi:hypothetical protein